MNISQTAVDGLVQEYSVEILPEALQELLEARITEVSSQARIDGFRPGKVPASLIRKRYGSELFGEIAQDQINSSIRKIIAENSLRPAMMPKIDVKTSDQNVGISLNVIVEVLPEISGLDISAIELSRPTAQPEQTDIERELKGLTHRLSDIADTEDGHKISDQDGVLVKISATSKAADVDVSMFNADERMVVMDDAAEPDFASHLKGKTAGETVETTIKLGKDFAVHELAGKSVDFVLEIKKVSKITIPDLDDEMAKKVGMESLEDLKARIGEDLQGQIDRQTLSIVKRRLLDTLAAQLDFELPPGLLASEFDSVWKVAEHGLAESKERGEEPATVDGMTEEEARTDAQRMAERRLRLGLYFSHEGEQAGIEVSEQDLQQRIYQMCMESPNPSEMYKLYNENERLQESLRSAIFEEKVTDSLLGRIKLTDSPMSVKDLFAIDPDADGPDANGTDAGDQPAAKPAQKKASAKKTAPRKASTRTVKAKDASETDTSTESPAKKAAPKKAAAKTAQKGDDTKGDNTKGGDK